VVFQLLFILQRQNRYVNSANNNNNNLYYNKVL
jgi:hypothetical protein